MTKPPKVRLRIADPLQDYYTDRFGDSYSVARLIDDAKGLPVFDVPLASLNLSSRIWDDCNIVQLAGQVKQVIDADMKYPILIDWTGNIADGRHRIIKALMEGKRTIKARRMHWKPVPDKKAEEE